jgi:hypothetical protein
MPGKLFVTERTGLVKLVDDATGVVAPNPYLDLTAVVNSAGGEQGLLGLAFSPDFATTGRLYVTFTDAAGALTLRRVTVSNPSALTAVSPAIEDLLSVPHPGATNHNGGSLAFDSAGRLLLGTGDGGGGGDPSDNARNTAVLLGKILRLDVSKACAPLRYCIPASNPFAAVGGRAEIWLWGLRNPWRTAIDPTTRSFYVADVGQDRWEELNIVPETTAGADLQWSCREGLEQFNVARCGAVATQIAPVTVMCHSAIVGCAPADRGASVIGGQVYRGSRFAAELTGAYVFGDFVSGNVWAWTGGGRSVISALPQVTSFGTDTHGELWATTLSGTLTRLELAGAVSPPAPPAGTGGSGTVPPPPPSSGGAPVATGPSTDPPAPTTSTQTPPTSTSTPAAAFVLPVRVTGLRLRQTGASTAIASWVQLPSASGSRTQFRLRRGAHKFGPWRFVATSRVAIKGLHKGQRYRLQVRVLGQSTTGPVSSAGLTAH